MYELHFVTSNYEAQAAVSLNIGERTGPGYALARVSTSCIDEFTIGFSANWCSFYGHQRHKPAAKQAGQSVAKCDSHYQPLRPYSHKDKDETGKAFRVLQ